MKRNGNATRPVSLKLTECDRPQESALTTNQTHITDSLYWYSHLKPTYRCSIEQMGRRSPGCILHVFDIKAQLTNAAVVRIRYYAYRPLPIVPLIVSAPPLLSFEIVLD